jgi:hypothetical protein
MAEKTIVAEIDGVKRTIKADIPDGSTPDQIEGAVRDFIKANPVSDKPPAGSSATGISSPGRPYHSMIGTALSKMGANPESVDALERFASHIPSSDTILGASIPAEGATAGLAAMGKRAVGVASGLAAAYGTRQATKAAGGALGVNPTITEILGDALGTAAGGYLAGKLSPQAAEQVESLFKNKGLGAVKAWLKERITPSKAEPGGYKINPNIAKRTQYGGSAPTEYGSTGRPERVGKAVSIEPVQEKPIEQFKVNPNVAKKMKYGGPAPSGAGSTAYGRGVKRGGINKLSAPETPSATSGETGVIEKKAVGPKPSPSGKLRTPADEFESVERTKAGAIKRRDNLKSHIKTNYPGLTKEQFMALPAKAKNQMIIDANPQSPKTSSQYIESSKVFQEFADHIWGK